MCPLKRAKKEKGRKEVVVVVVRIIVNNNLNTEVFVGKEGKNERKGECDDYSIPFYSMIESILFGSEGIGSTWRSITQERRVGSKAILDYKS